MWFLLIPLKQSIFQHPVCFYIHFWYSLHAYTPRGLSWESTFLFIMVFQNTFSISLLVFPTWFRLEFCHPRGCYTSSFMFRIFFSILLFTLKTCPYHLILLFTHLLRYLSLNYFLFFIPYLSLLVFPTCPQKFCSAIRLLSALPCVHISVLYITILKSTGYMIYQQVWHSKIVHSSHTVFCVVYLSWSKQQLLLCIT